MTHNPTPCKLILEDGTIFDGQSFGYHSAISGEVVFNTAMVGYPESLTDPSYSGQILCFTYPLIGNYGVPQDEVLNQLSMHFESEKIHIAGLVVSNYSEQYSHWNAQQSLSEWLIKHQIPAIEGVDTRALTKLIREKGSLKGKIVFTDQQADELPYYDPSKDNLVAKTSCTEIITYGQAKLKIVLVDCGVKHNIIRCLLKRDVTVIRVPWDYDFNTLEYDGLFISNGPGNPEHCTATVANIKKAFDLKKPIFGICMGNQLLALAGGAKTYKLKYGHRSHNQPVRMVGTNKCLITSQNHSYAVDNDSLSADWEPLFENMNDQSNEGIRHKQFDFYSAQFHPEAASGATDAEFLFDDFVEKVRKNAAK